MSDIQPIAREASQGRLLKIPEILTVVVLAIAATIAIFTWGTSPDNRLGLIIALATFVVTYIYVMFTYGLLKANLRMVQIQNDSVKAQLEMVRLQVESSSEQTRPFVVVSFPSQDDAVHIQIENVGNRPALDVHIAFDKDLSEIKQRVAWGDDRTGTYSDTILHQPFLRPSEEILTLFAEPERIVNDLSDDECRFSVTIEYRDLADREYVYTYPIDLRSYIHGEKIRQYTIEHRLEQIGKHLEHLKDVNRNLKHVASSIEDLVPPKTHYIDGTPIG